MNRCDPDLERMLADADSELPPPPGRTFQLEELTARRLRRRGLALGLGLVAFAAIWTLTLSAAGLAPPITPGRDAAAYSPSGTQAIDSLQAAIRDLQLRVQRGTAMVLAEAKSAEARARQARLDLRLRSELAAVRADAATTFLRSEATKR